MGSRNFKLDFLSHNGIEGFFQPEKKGGQKTVHFVVRRKIKQVMKIFDGGKDERFEREMMIYEKFKSSDGIPRIYEICEYEGEAIVFEEFVEGKTLEDILDEYTGNNAKVVELLKDIFQILTPIWKQSLVHRDIKPANIIIRPNGKPVILDFGIARDLSDDSITGTGGPQPGTWKWAAPEQYAGQKEMISYRTDFFSIGVVAFHLYHKDLPFGRKPEDIDAKFKSGNENFQISDTCMIKDFLRESMRFKPSHRPRNIEDLVNLFNI